MVSSVTILWLVAALSGGAFSLTCFHCNTTNRPSCEDFETVCDSKFDVCLTTVTEIRSDKGQVKATRHVVKTCGEKKNCNQTYSMSFNSTSLYAATKCCETNKCKTEEPDLLKTLAKENKISCPTCNEPNIKCSSPLSITCLGEEMKCVSYESKEGGAASTKHQWKGCATDNVCTMQNMSTLPMGHILETRFQCSHAPPLLSVLLLPVAFGLAMLKLLL
ncbi:phospholipase A2 inhibitor gamma subunit B-like [Hyperolius riggenbachi]|uniref:phospholipase A2 inhibitor gamma subunit B-like n=1 Tax=Hyperolius riggenbachi TaxID=752182 RepID=UPI0035A27F73